MKKIVQVVLLLATFQIANAQQAGQLVIKGDITKVKEKIAQVKIYINEEWDSCKVINGKFSFKFNIKKPTLFPIDFCPRIGENPVTDNDSYYKYRRLFYFEPGIKTITCIDSIFTCKSTGSKYDVAFQEFHKKQKPILDALKPLENKMDESYKKKDTATAEQLRREYISQYDSTNAKFCFAYALKNTQSPILFYILNQANGYPFNATRMETVFNKLPKSVQQSTEGKELKEKIANALKVGIGKMAPDFTQADTSGHAVSLSSFRGKYVLLDFWGSWCGPCRMENPVMLKAFNNFHNKGFTILSVAADDSKEKWLGAIHQDGTGLWTHVSDLKGHDNVVCKLYSIVGYPTNFLIDPSGKIIEENLRGGYLEKKLAEVMK